MNCPHFQPAATAPRKRGHVALRRRATNAYTRAIDFLETRILFQISPFTIAANGKSATYTDVDGDKVTIAVSVGTLTQNNFVGTFTGVGSRAQCEMIFLTLGGFDGANIALKVARAAGGDGLVNVGSIYSNSHNLGNITIPGDLGKIEAGADTAGVPAVKSLSVRSMGRFGVNTQGAEPDLSSVFSGALGSLSVTRDIKDAFLSVTSATPSQGTIGPITVGGSLIGGGGGESGSIRATGNIGAVKVGHDLIGGGGIGSARIISDGSVSSAAVGGSLIGGAGNNSGLLGCGGNMGNVTVGGDLRGSTGYFCASVSAGGSLGNVTIGGSLIGADATLSAALQSAGNMGAVKIGHDLQGGAGDESGLVSAGGILVSMSIGGSFRGGSGELSGYLNSSGDMGAVSIGGSLQGGTGNASGYISCGSHLKTLTIGGSLNGGTGGGSGFVGASGIGAIKIAGNLTGASIAGALSLNGSGYINSGSGRITSIFIGGSIITGVDASSGTLTRNASIQSGADIGSLTVHGNIIGNAGPGGITLVIISAAGQTIQGSTTDLAFGKITVDGRVEYANILAGFDSALVAVDGHAQIGTVKIGDDWIASNLVAGVSNSASGNTLFGDGNDASIGAGNPNITAAITSITIGGQIFGTPAAINNADVFGFVAQQIGSLKVGGAAVTLSAGAHNDDVAPFVTAADVFVHEV